ncbi:hypothetical protein [Sphingomonas morindae]|uniref:Lipoprotein n=1 Tax=Sphingomonas morindae TaxID=1541170 RepID=A0ABY4X3D2_9SPHN|nr:hypothetical protein [Sphingomonas morindae]USI71398.1 hypothetical protein LHA26_08570 [Sphingomonas morindae]
MMRVALLVPLLLLPACQQRTEGDRVRAAYDNKADAVEAQAQVQPTAVAKTIYKAQADALREEGRDRQKGLEGRSPSKGQGDRASNAGVGGDAAAPPR